MPEPTPTVGSLLAEALRAQPTDRLDLELLLGEVLGLSRAGLLRERDTSVDALAAARFADLLNAHRAGRPVAQLLGRREFWSLSLEIDEHVLIPRPDTELLVETGLRLLGEAPPGAMVDLGTGSGAVALALASELEGQVVIGIDDSSAALRVAARNVARLAPRQVRLLRGRWLAALAPASCALIVSNPPYLEAGDPALAADGALRYEPTHALASGPAGLDDLRAIAIAAPRCLMAGGWLALEHGASQGAAVRGLLAATGFEHIDTLRDLAGHERVSCGRRPADLRPVEASDILR